MNPKSVSSQHLGAVSTSMADKPLKFTMSRLNSPLPKPAPGPEGHSVGDTIGPVTHPETWGPS